MAPALFVMAIMGCGDGASPCTQARVLPTRYESAAQCQAALPQALAENTDVSAPTISAMCRAEGKRVVEIDAKGKAKG